MKNILISGVSSGIGYATTQSFIRKNYRVFGSVRSSDDAQRLSTQFGSQFHPLIFDLKDPKSIENGLTEMENILGPDQGLDGLINNAGISHTGPVEHLTMEEIREQFEVNVMGMIMLTKACLNRLGADPHFQPGKIINISSVGGKVALPFMAAYVATKHAMEGFSHSIRRELSIYGIKVIIIGPGAVKTPIFEKQIGNGKMKRFDDTAYQTGIENFKQQAEQTKETGLEPGETGDRIIQIFEKENPKPRYPLVKGKFANYTLLRIIPDQMMDRMIQSRFQMASVRTKDRRN